MYKLLKKSESGFSLLELVVAVAVAGIIAAVAVPTFIGLQGDATTESASYETSISGNHSDVTNEAGYWTGNGGSEQEVSLVSYVPGVDFNYAMRYGQIGTAQALYLSQLTPSMSQAILGLSIGDPFIVDGVEYTLAWYDGNMGLPASQYYSGGSTDENGAINSITITVDGPEWGAADWSNVSSLSF